MSALIWDRLAFSTVTAEIKLLVVRPIDVIRVQPCIAYIEDYLDPIINSETMVE